MAQILKFPVQASKFGYKRVKRRGNGAENQDQLDLFPCPNAQILHLTSALSRFDEALLFDERGDVKAAELYAKAIEEQDCVADAYCNLGIIESQKGNTAVAFDRFTTSLKNDLRLAQIHYEIAAEVEPTFPNVHFNLALVQAINHDLAAAISSLDKYQALVSE